MYNKGLTRINSATYRKFVIHLPMDLILEKGYTIVGGQIRIGDSGLFDISNQTCSLLENYGSQTEKWHPTKSNGRVRAPLPVSNRLNFYAGLPLRLHPVQARIHCFGLPNHQKVFGVICHLQTLPYG